MKPIEPLTVSLTVIPGCDIPTLSATVRGEQGIQCRRKVGEDREFV